MTTEPEAIPADVLVSIPRDFAERVTEIANRNEQSVEGDKLAVLLSASGASRAPVDGAVAVAWLAEGYGYQRVFLDKEAADKLSRGGEVRPLYTHPTPASPDAEMVRAPVGWVIDANDDGSVSVVGPNGRAVTLGYMPQGHADASQLLRDLCLALLPKHGGDR